MKGCGFLLARILILIGLARAKEHTLEQRDGTVVIVTMDGDVVSWVNDYTGLAVTELASTSTQGQPEPVVSPSGSFKTCLSWDSLSDEYIRQGFGQQTEHNNLPYIYYKGNVGNPWGSNIIEVSAEQACRYRYVIRLVGSKEEWTVVFWNKFGPDGKLTGWYGHSALSIGVSPGQSRYVAVDEDTQGAFGAAVGRTLPVDQDGGYSCTWGEFDFGNRGNDGWSGWDVSAIQAQAAGHEVQGMQICDSRGDGCSSITQFATKVEDAYTKLEEGLDGIGGSAIAGPVRLIVQLDYKGKDV
jgi:hypothetical protein